MKNCSKCNQQKPTSEYHKDKRNSDGLYGWCKTCACEKSMLYRQNNIEKVRENQRAARNKNPDAYKNKSLKYTFGITLDEYNELLEKQNYVCAVCNKPEKEIHPQSKKIRNLNVDHCHETGKIRGLLCNSCNRGIGLLRDDPNLLFAAIQYLKRSSPPPKQGAET